MKKFVLSTFLILTVISGFSTKWTITSPGFVFSPDTLTITVGDSVQFTLGAFHSGKEVSQAVWDTNGVAGNGGFNTPFGGGLILPAQLSTGTHWYVCANHFSMGMKGVIIVTPPAGMTAGGSITVYEQPFPNPFTNKITVAYKDADAIIIYDMLGNKVKSILLNVSETKMGIDMAALPQGMYFYHLMKGGAIVSTKKIVKS